MLLKPTCNFFSDVKILSPTLAVSKWVDFVWKCKYCDFVVLSKHCCLFKQADIACVVQPTNACLGKQWQTKKLHTVAFNLRQTVGTLPY